MSHSLLAATWFDYNDYFFVLESSGSILKVPPRPPPNTPNVVNSSSHSNVSSGVNGSSGSNISPNVTNGCTVSQSDNVSHVSPDVNGSPSGSVSPVDGISPDYNISRSGSFPLGGSRGSPNCISLPSGNYSLPGDSLSSDGCISPCENSPIGNISLGSSQ